MALTRDLGEDRQQRLAREVLEPQVGVEWTGVVAQALGAVGRHGRDHRRGRRARALEDRLVRMRLRRRVGRIDRDRPVAVGHAVGRGARRAVDRSDERVRVRGERGGVERRVLDGVAHAVHPLVAHRLDVHERAAVVEPELAVLVVVDPDAEVHVLGWRPDVDLDVLQDRGHRRLAERQQLLRCARSRSAMPPSTRRSRPAPPPRAPRRVRRAAGPPRGPAGARAAAIRVPAPASSSRVRVSSIVIPFSRTSGGRATAGPRS